MKKHIKSEKGYTLVELLAVMIVLTALGTILGTIIISVFRGTNKTNAVTMVRQNGNFALTQMAKMIRNAKRFEGISTTGAVGTYVGTCVATSAGAGTPTPTPAQYKYLQITTFDNDARVTFSCQGGSGSNSGYIASSSATINNQPLIDISQVTLNPQNGSTCYFTCTQVNLADNPVIHIFFDLSTKNDLNAASFFESKSGVLNFQTSIDIRN